MFLFWMLCGISLCFAQDRVRLMFGANPYEGTVEARIDGQWTLVCDDAWDEADARVVCNELFGTGVTRVVKNNYFGGPRESKQFRIFELNCQGNESSITECENVKNYECFSNEMAGVICDQTASDFSTRIVPDNPSNKYKGRLEVTFDGTNWGTVTNFLFYKRTADAACRELFGTASTRRDSSDSFTRRGSGSILMRRVQCAGGEDSLNYCLHRPNNPCYQRRNNGYRYCIYDVGDNIARHSNDVGIECHTPESNPSYSVRLVNGTTTREGLIEVSQNGGPASTVCSYGFYTNNARVLCHQLFNASLDMWRAQPYVLDNHLLHDRRCVGYESDISRCKVEWWKSNRGCEDSDKGVYLKCFDEPAQRTQLTIELVNGTNQYEGRIEIILPNNKKGTIVWYYGEADIFSNIVCRQLFNTGVVEARTYRFGNITESLSFSSWQCKGSEQNIGDCNYFTQRPWSTREYYGNMGVVCEHPASDS